ncbi:MAG: ribbon-helix-helix protein, CopG family [Desulfurococcaceae archaeon]
MKTSSGKEEKRLVYVSKSLVDRLLEEARRQGSSISKLVEDSIRSALQVMEMDYSLEKAVEVLRAFRLLKVLGGVFAPKPILECLEADTCTTPEEILTVWRSSGRAYGIYLREKSSDPIKTLTALLETSRWELGEVVIESTGKRYKLRLVSASLTEGETQSILEFVKGVLEGLNCSILGVESTRGIVLVEFEPQKQ